MLHTTRICLICCIAALLGACNGQQPTEEPIAPPPAVEETAPSIDQQARMERVKNIMYTLPSPFETLTLLRESGVPYTTEFLFDPKLVSKFDGSLDKSIVLGVYGANLSYVSVFEDDKSSIRYLACVNSLMKDLNIGNAFSGATMERIMNNRANADSVQQIVSEAYYSANVMLKDNAQEHLAAVVLAGGWLEGLYIATQLAQTTPDNAELIATITDQKYALENLLELLGTFDGHHQVNALSERLEELHALFDASTKETATTVEEREQNGQTVTVIGGGLESTLSADQLTAITKLVLEVRAGYLSAG